MGTINCEHLFKNELDKLWQNASQSLSVNPHLKDLISRGYAIEREVEKESLLIVSMNPSFSDKPNAWNNGNSHGSVFYKIPAKKSPNGTNDFFNAINEFYDDIKKTCRKSPPLAHHDLLYVRETKQKNVTDWIRNKMYASLFSPQLAISKKIIELSNPKLIVVLNAGARELFKELFGNGSFDNKLGAFMYCINGKDTPVLFSGMLSGQHALDLGSKKSLKWHIEFILKQIP
jgi:hypothetical protein